MNELKEVPYLNEILKYVPIESSDEVDVVNYINKYTKNIILNYSNDEYQQAYFGVHILFMTYIYSLIWQISYIKKDRYNDGMIYCREYGSKKFKYDELKSIFDFSRVPE